MTTAQRPRAANDSAELALDRLASDFKIALRAERKAPTTLLTYLGSLELFIRFAADHGVTTLGGVTRTLVREFTVDLEDKGRKPATVSVRWRSLQRFFNFLVEEEVIPQSPMDRMDPPRVPLAPPPVIREDALTELFAATTADRTFAGARDAALLLLLAETGIRRAEVTGLRLDDLDLDRGELRVHGKGDRVRTVGFGAQTARVVSAYLRKRTSHGDAQRDELWLGRRGPLTASGVRQIVKTRGGAVGIMGLHPHQLRHTFAHHFLADGGQESDLMRITGWESPQMLRRYAASTAEERAIDAQRKHSLGDRIVRAGRGRRRGRTIG